MKAFVVDSVRGAHAQAVGMPAAPFRIVAIEDRHVAADSARTLEEAARRGIGLDGRDDLDEGEAEGKQRVFEAVPAHMRILIGELHPEDRLHIGNHARQILRHQADLPQAEIIGHLSVP